MAKPLIWLRNLLLIKGTPIRKKMNQYLTSHELFYERALKYSKSRCYIDGTKSIRRAELFIQYGKTSNPKIIYLIRDGRAFCYSYLKNKALSKGHLKEAANAWLSYINLVNEFSLRHPSIDLITVRYEDLCSNPHAALTKICNFLDLEFEEEMITELSEHHIFGNRMRNSFNGIIKEDLSWKSQFTSSEIEELNTLLKPQLENYGY